MRRSRLIPLAVLLLAGCEAAPRAVVPVEAQAPLSSDAFAALVERISEDGGFFDTDNLISNETGYLNVVDALVAEVAPGGAYIGVGPDQNYSYIAHLRPEVVFITDVRRDNLLHHLLLKALIEEAETPLEFLSALHGAPVPPGAEVPSIEDAVAVVDSAAAAARGRGGDGRVLPPPIRARLLAAGVPLSAEDLATIERFHAEFVRLGMDLRFTTFGRPPRPYYPTYRQLVLETDVDGDPASWLSDPSLYRVVRELHLANRIVPVVGDLAGPGALREIGRVLDEMGVELSAVYVSNVEFYLWQARTFDRWVENLRAVPARPDAVVVRSYFPNFGGGHPSAVPGYYATQSLQRVASLLDGDFTSYWDVVTRDVIPLR